VWRVRPSTPPLSPPIHLFPGRAARVLSLVAALVAGSSRAAAQEPPAAPPPTDAKAPDQAKTPPNPAPPLPPPSPPEPAPEPPRPPTGFAFGSYGRMIAATDFHGRPGRDADIVNYGSRLDEGNYVELEMRRDDYWNVTKTGTRLVATLAFGAPVFHYTTNFDVSMAVRNLYLEARGLGGSNLSMWVGSRMYRGDDIYLLNFWPLDNLNTMGGGVRYDFTPNTFVAAHLGMMQPSNDFFLQQVNRAPPFNQPGSAQVLVLNRQKMIGSLKASHIFRFGESAGLKTVLYSEVHHLPQGQRETLQEGIFETLPSNVGWVIGAQIGAFSGKRDTHVNLFLRYAGGLAAYGDFTTPDQLGPDKTTSGARELLVALGANWETGPFGLMAGTYFRSFRNASQGLDFKDIDEGIVAVRPHLFFGELGGLALEGSFQAQQRGAVAPADANGNPGSGPVMATLFRFGVMPFISPAGRGDFSRPQFRLIYAGTVRNSGAKALYPTDDAFSIHTLEHFFGFGVEWWFNSTSYGN
jgi:maltoporin